MNLNISPVNAVKISAPSFGMAKFTDQGLKLAQSCSDTCDFLDSPIEFQDAAFFEKKKFLRKAPFARFMEKTISRRNSSDEAVTRVTDAIIECGTTHNAFANARFVKQLLTTRDHIQTLNDGDREMIGAAIEEVFKANWNNPELSKEETLALLELAKPAVDDKKYVTLTGVIEKSDTRTPKK